MKLMATCPICREPIWMDSPSVQCARGSVHPARDFDAFAEEHLRSHPAPIVRRFWLRSSFERLPESECVAVLTRGLARPADMAGHRDRRGIYSIDEALGSVAMYKLWLEANRSSYTT